jgi:hypothetical protein
MSLVLQFDFNCTLFKSWQSRLHQNPQNNYQMVSAFCQKEHLSIWIDFSFWTIFNKMTHCARRGGPPTCLQTLLEVFKLGYIDSAELLLVYVVCSSCLTGATLYDVHTQLPYKHMSKQYIPPSADSHLHHCIQQDSVPTTDTWRLSLRFFAANIIIGSCMF